VPGGHDPGEPRGWRPTVSELPKYWKRLGLRGRAEEVFSAMNITLLTLGTRGDVQPFIAFGLGLQRAGHRVCLATHGHHEAFVREYGLGFAPIAGDLQAILATEGGQRWLDNSTNPPRYALQFIRYAAPLAERGFAEIQSACQGADLVLTTVFGMLVVYHVTECTGQPVALALLQPAHPTREFPVLLSPVRSFGGVYNRMTYWLTIQAILLASRPAMDRARRKVLGLRGLPWNSPLGERLLQTLPSLYAFSPHVVPRPADWGAHIHLTGYWFLDAPPDYRPPEALQRFLDGGPPPVYVGFGSMTRRDPARLTRVVLEALRRTGQRGVLLRGWGGLESADLPANVFAVDAIPHDWLFPRTAAVVHHGGAGTTAAGLRAGRPSVLTPIFGDQYFWAQRVADLGAGPPGLPHKALTAEGLAAAIDRAVNDADLRRRAAALGEKLRAEDGVAAAVAHVAQLRAETARPRRRRRRPWQLYLPRQLRLARKLRFPWRSWWRF